MKRITSTLLSLFFAFSVALGQGTLTIIDNGSHIILNVEGKPTSYPKNELTVQQKGNLAIIFKQRGLVIQQISSNTKVTSPTSTSMSDLFQKILAMMAISSTSFAVPVYSDNAAATSGGLDPGKMYRTSTGTLMIVY